MSPKQSVSISKKEWYFATAIIIAVIIITTLPYLYAWLSAPQGKFYTGQHFINIPDRYVYYSYMEQTRQGHWLFKDLYTSEQQPRNIFNPFWLTLGLIGRGFNLSNALIFHLARIFLIPIFLFLAYFIISYFFHHILKRKICFLLLCFSSGVGGFLTPRFLKKVSYLKNWFYAPPDIWVPESNTFFTLYHNPLFILSLALLILSLFLLFRAFKENKVKYSLLAGLSSLVLFSFHPYQLVTLWLVPLILLLIIFLQKKKILWSYFKHYSIYLALSLPSAFYWAWLSQHNFVFLEKAVHNVGITPSFPLVIIGYGFIFILALLGILFLFCSKKINHSSIFITTWLLIGLVLIYSPIPWQRRLMEGLHFPMVILATIGLSFLYKKFRQKLSYQKFDLFFNNKILFIFLFIVLFCFSNLYLIGRDLYIFLSRQPFVYLSLEKKSSFEWIKKTISEDAIFLSSGQNGALIPGMTGRTVYLGHIPETIFCQSKIQQADWFFRDNRSDRLKIDFLKKQNINYIFYSKEEKEMGQFDPKTKDYLEKVYENELVSIYKVKH